MKISFSLPQADLPRIQDRQRSNSLTAAIDTHGADGGTLSTRRSISSAMRSTTRPARSNCARPIANADSRLVPGQLVDVGVTLERAQGAIVVPHDAVNLGPNGHYVYVVAGRQSRRCAT